MDSLQLSRANWAGKTMDSLQLSRANWAGKTMDSLQLSRASWAGKTMNSLQLSRASWAGKTMDSLQLSRASWAGKTSKSQCHKLVRFATVQRAGYKPDIMLSTLPRWSAVRDLERAYSRNSSSIPFPQYKQLRRA
ncbi:hypothetical protein ElyMa_005896600 [Elysia marginata]|uniref:Uncharacterized protein n=1 Tax=Elysia marginata TaxID=1093978 RepID=A0AAV4G4Q0_9GAST|nr:hypothetical protein ElyMa_005896600 [Elysia marginata]